MRGAEFARVGGWAAVLGGEELGGDLGADPGPVVDRHRGVPGEPAGPVELAEPAGHLDPEVRHLPVADRERRTQPQGGSGFAVGRVGWKRGEVVRADRGQPGAEQGLHLLGGHRRAGEVVADAGAAGTDPHPGDLAAFGVVRRQSEMPLLGDVLHRDLPGQVVIARPRRQLVQRHHNGSNPSR